MLIERLSQAVILTVTAVTMIYFVGFPASSDFRAVWLAGEFFKTGNPAMIYTGSGDVFTMEPPAPWIERTLDDGLKTAVYPFIYPPLWAWVSSLLVAAVSFSIAVAVITCLNLLMLLSMPLLARRIVGDTVSATVYLLLMFPLFAFTFPFLLPLEENQPQILVSFLILLAIERTRSGAPIWGGLALAVAASIKLYPALFALLWLFGGERRATLAFALAGGTLGLLSIFVAGWDMHLAFLNEIGAISRSALYSYASFSLDPFIARIGYPSELVPFDTEVTGGTSQWMVMEKTGAWRAVNVTLFLAVLLYLLHMSSKGWQSNAFFWPLAFLLLAFVSPLTWVYHLIPVFVFLPALLHRYRRLPTFCLYVLLIIMLRSSSIFGTSGLLIAMPGTHELIFATLLLLTGIFLLIATEASDRPLHPDGQSL